MNLKVRFFLARRRLTLADVCDRRGSVCSDTDLERLKCGECFAVAVGLRYSRLAVDDEIDRSRVSALFSLCLGCLQHCLAVQYSTTDVYVTLD